LVPLLAPYLPLPTEATYPLPRTASLRLRDPTIAGASLLDDKVPEAQKIGGIVGFVVTKVRADAALGYVLLAPYLRVGALTAVAWGYLLRLAAYLVATIDLPLVLACGGSLRHGLEGAHLFGVPHYQLYVDSSHGNAEEGKSIGGFAMLGDGGANYWKVVTPERVADSSGNSELIVATLALKTTLGVNTLLESLRLAGVAVRPPRPTTFLLDAAAVISGATLERITKLSRWVASRKAMLHSAVTAGVIDLRKVPGEDNVADILTKTLTGPDFDKHRAAILGLGHLSPATLAALPPALRDRVAAGVTALAVRAAARANAPQPPVSVQAMAVRLIRLDNMPGLPGGKMPRQRVPRGAPRADTYPLHAGGSGALMFLGAGARPDTMPAACATITSSGRTIDALGAYLLGAKPRRHPDQADGAAVAGMAHTIDARGAYLHGAKPPA
jgi:hypothetical protein